MALSPPSQVGQVAPFLRAGFQFVGQEACLRVTNVCFRKFAKVQVLLKFGKINKKVFT